VAQKIKLRFRASIDAVGHTDVTQNTGFTLSNVRQVSVPTSMPDMGPPSRPGLVLLGVGLLALFLPTLAALDQTIWVRDGQGHGPVILALIAWLLWQRWPAFRDAPTAPAPVSATILALLGLAIYLLGRTQDLLFLDTLAQPVLLASLALMLKGWPGCRILLYPLAFYLFAVPVPTSIVDTLTAPLKMAVSVVSESVLAALHFPVARQGVQLVIGPYWLLVADACAGMNSIFALEAVGVFYLSLIQNVRRARQVSLALMILPISFVSNVTRVCSLVLITYLLGDEAGQGFLHGFAGVFLFVIATMLTLSADWVLARIFPGERQPLSTAQPVAAVPQSLALPIRRAAALSAGCLIVASLGQMLQPRIHDDVISQNAFDKLIPATFGGWQQVADTGTQVQTLVTQGTLSQQQPYDAQVLRTYVHRDGARVMLAIAYGANQRQEIKVHRPEVCYPAAGRAIQSLTPTRFPLQTADGRPVTGYEMLAVEPRRQGRELVTYWIRLGNTFTANGLKQRLHILQRGLRGERTDGVLVRFSQYLAAGDTVSTSQQTQFRFAQDFMGALSPQARHLLVDGAP